MGTIRRIGKFYAVLIMKCIGIFIFIGILSVVFQDHGWFPNEDMYAISQFIYLQILPVLIAWEGGRVIGGDRGALLAVLAVSGVILADSSIGILGAMAAGPVGGSLWRWEEKRLEGSVRGSLQMLTRNLCLGLTGALLASSGFYLVSPVLKMITAVLYRGMDLLIEHRLTALLSIGIEPAKVFFLNNVVNHAVLVPLGMGQVRETGHSMLFLLETNPGPGLGLLSALYCRRKGKREELAAALFAQSIGGVHEVYFPYVLSKLKLLFPLILGGMAGSFCFSVSGAGLVGPVSPGSLLVICLMAGRSMLLPVALGVAVSAAVSFGGSMLVLRTENAEKAEEETAVQIEEPEMEKLKKIENILFVCDGGMGSSAMGAALLRRTLGREGIDGIRVEAVAVDLVPDTEALLVCQSDFYRTMPEELLKREIYTLESLVSPAEYAGLLKLIRERNG